MAFNPRQITKRAKSKTYWLAAVIMSAPAIYESMPLLKDFLGEHYNLAIFITGALVAVLRELTTKPVSEK